MITKSDLILLLTNLQEEGIDVQKELRQTFQTNDLMPILKFINSKRQLSATEFYTHIRKSYNHKKSVLYKNIVSEEIAEAEDVLTTLASLNLQILLFCKKLQEKDKLMFLQHVRFLDINKCLYQYGKTFDLTGCQKLLKFIKTDIKALESLQ